MTTVSSDEILKILPSFFELDFKGSMNLFRKLEKFLIFDEGFVYYANPDSLQLKYSYKNHSQYSIESIFEFGMNLKKSIFSTKSEILKQNSKLIEYLNLKQFHLNSFLVSKISIKSTVFGIIILASKQENFYTANDLNSLNAASSILSYVLKDIELSNVFKIQLQALKDGIKEKNMAYKTIKEQNEKILEADKVKN